MPILLFSLSGLTAEHLTLLSASALVSGMSMWTLDDNARNFAQTHRNYDGLFDGVNSLGDGRYHALLFGAGYIAGEIFHNDKLKEVSREGMESFLISGITVMGLKIAFGRARPYTNEGPLSFHPLNLNNDYHSFPSGHTIVAFSAASVISSNFRHPLVYASTYTLATGVALARIYKDKHWLSDVIMGAALGAVIGWKIGSR